MLSGSLHLRGCLSVLVMFCGYFSLMKNSGCLEGSRKDSNHAENKYINLKLSFFVQEKKLLFVLAPAVVYSIVAFSFSARDLRILSLLMESMPTLWHKKITACCLHERNRRGRKYFHVVLESASGQLSSFVWLVRKCHGTL